MISTGTILACLFTLLVSLLLPLACLVIYGVRSRKQGIWSAWLLGAAGFVVPQLLIRTPILNALAGTSGFLTFAQEHPWLFGFSLAVTAALFELAGRLGAALLMRRRLTPSRAVAAGMGHGGIEAMLLIGMSYINNLVYIFLIRSGGFDALVAQTAAAGVDPSALLAVRDSLLNLPAGMFLLAGYERLVTMFCHAAMSVMVCYGVSRRRVLPWALACLGVHTFIDSVPVIQNLVGKGLSQMGAYAAIYLLLTAAAVFCVALMRRILRSWRQAEVDIG